MFLLIFLQLTDLLWLAKCMPAFFCLFFFCGNSYRYKSHHLYYSLGHSPAKCWTLGRQWYSHAEDEHAPRCFVASVIYKVRFCIICIHVQDAYLDKWLAKWCLGEYLDLDQMNKIAHVGADVKQGQWSKRLFFCKSGLRYWKVKTHTHYLNGKKRVVGGENLWKYITVMQ